MSAAGYRYGRDAIGTLEIRNGRVIDPASGTDRHAPVYVADGAIAARLPSPAA
jgi:predicted amidohydrolase